MELVKEGGAGEGKVEQVKEGGAGNEGGAGEG